MWFSLIPALIIGIFLFLIWRFISPFEYMKQLTSERRARRKAYEEDLQREQEE